MYINIYLYLYSYLHIGILPAARQRARKGMVRLVHPYLSRRQKFVGGQT